MKLKILSVVAFASCAAAAWTAAQKIGIYSMIQRMSQSEINSMEERVAYGKMAIFFDDWLTSAQLSSPVDSSQYRSGLFSLLAHISTIKADAAKDVAGNQNIEYLISRIRSSYGDSLYKFFGHPN
ncbi:hypothetical protein H4R99_006968 [Coemansia sp. RSA 1722]|nr:hypothetical protein H4R99_006968 [Coemansia sp. RSA 1722]